MKKVSNIAFVLLVAYLIGYIYLQSAAVLADEKIIVEESDVQRDVVMMEIGNMADEYGIDRTTAFDIAECESHFDRYAKNPNSTAKGVYQFTDTTWKYIKAPGHQFDFKENIKQFMIWYPIHADWWECNK